MSADGLLTVSFLEFHVLSVTSQLALVRPHLERLNGWRGHSWFLHVALNMPYHFTGPQFLHQPNGVVIPVLRWRRLVRCPVLSLQVHLYSRLPAPYPPPSPKSHPAHIQQNPKWAGMTSCPRMMTAESVIPPFHFPSKVPKPADYPPPHVNGTLLLDPSITSPVAVSPSRVPKLLPVSPLCVLMSPNPALL